MGFFDFINDTFIDPSISIGKGLLGISNDNSQSIADSTNAANAKLSANNEALQERFAKQGIQWRVADAKAAGLHPLAALGAQTSSFTPSTIGTVSPRPTTNKYTAMGQNFKGAISATLNAPQKTLAKIQILQAQATLKNMNLQNMSLARSMRDLNSTPSMPLDGGNSSIPGQPMEYDPQIISGSVGMQSGVQPMQKWAIDQNFNLRRILGKAAEESLENDTFGNIKYFGSQVANHLRSLTGGASTSYIKRSPKYNQWVNNNKPNVPGLNKADIAFNWVTNTYYIRKSARNKYRANKGYRMKKSH